MLFEAPAVRGATLDWRGLPALRADTSDPQHGWLSNVAAEDPAERLRAPGGRARRLSPEVLAGPGAGRARAAPADRRRRRPSRRCWPPTRGSGGRSGSAGWSALQREDFPAAQAAFNAVYGQVPGELAPKLALALACERGGEADVAESLYRTCAGTDANYVAPAAFGLARIRGARGDVAGAVAALDLVPSTSRGFTDARRLRASYLAEDGDGLPALAPGHGQPRRRPARPAARRRS